MKRSPLRCKSRPRKGPDELERMAAFKSAAWEQRRCLVCPRDPVFQPADTLIRPAWHAHHVVTQQHVRRADGDVFDPRNAMRLCVPCHDAHHNRTRPIPGPCVPSPAGKFAIELLGRERAVAYFERYYDCSLSRVEPSPSAVDWSS